jgi:hydrogenase nickel incorporation protein HypA/HybF
MHELSLVQALVRLVDRYAPSGGEVTAVHMRAGPLQAIEDETMQFAWRAATEATRFAGARLQLEQLPWHLLCPDCGREWDSEELYADCVCGGRSSRPIGGDELTLVALDILEASLASDGEREDRS